MALVGVESALGVLVATEYDGYAVSEPVFQDEGEADFTSLVNIEAKFEFKNISEATEADKLLTQVKIYTGDSLVIVKDDDTVVEITVGEVTQVFLDVRNACETMTSNMQNGYIVEASSVMSSSYDSFKAFDDDNSFWHSNEDEGTGWITYEFPELKKIFKYRIVPRAEMNNTAYVKTWALEGWNGADWNIVHLQDTALASTEYTSYEYTCTYPAEYIKYRLRAITTDGDKTSIVGLELLEATTYKYEFDTLTATQGEIPSRVYDTNASLGFNDGDGYTEATISGDIYELIDPGDFSTVLETTRTYDDLSIANRSLKTRIELKNIGDKCMEVSADLWKGD